MFIYEYLQLITKEQMCIRDSFRVVKESNDEIGLIIEKMKELTQSLGSIVGKIRNSSDTMLSLIHI